MFQLDNPTLFVKKIRGVLINDDQLESEEGRMGCLFSSFYSLSFSLSSPSIRLSHFSSLSHSQQGHPASFPVQFTLFFPLKISSISLIHYVIHSQSMMHSDTSLEIRDQQLVSNSASVRSAHS